MLRRDNSWDKNGIRNSLYGRKWRTARATFLAANPCCTMCQRDGLTVTATVVDHVVPHRGDRQLFWDQSNWQSLCAHHHNSEKARVEIRGYSTELGPDGWPLDQQHPANTGHDPISGKSQPEGLRRIERPVYLVCGPQGAGKSTWCRQQMKPGDQLIDYDEIAAARYGTKRVPGQLFVPVLRERNRMLMEAAEMSEGSVYLPITGAKNNVRQWWKSTLGNVIIVMIATPFEACRQHIQGDPRRTLTAAEEIIRVRNWWEEADFSNVDVLISED